LPRLTVVTTALRQGALGRLTVEKADGATILGTDQRSSALRRALEDAGFVATPRGLRLRG
jgi:ATP-dependent Lhr-like helicase